MTTTKKQQTITERVNSESAYMRAAAVWVARRMGRDVGRIYGVTFYRQNDEHNESGTWWPGEMGIAYFDNGRERLCSFDSVDTPGRFLEECVAILEEMK